MPEWESTFTWEPGHCAQTDNAGAAKCEASKLSLTQTASLPLPVSLSLLSSHFIHGLSQKPDKHTGTHTGSRHINTHTHKTHYVNLQTSLMEEEGGRKERGGKERHKAKERNEFLTFSNLFFLCSSISWSTEKIDRETDTEKEVKNEKTVRKSLDMRHSVREREFVGQRRAKVSPFSQWLGVTKQWAG